jgi:starvation-inducible DNA-binding protein
MKPLNHAASTIPQLLPARALPRAVNAAPAGKNAAEAGALLTRLIQDESALYAITRDWRYNADSRKFIRLHALLDEQFTEIGVRLVRLAQHSRELGGGNSMGRAEPAATARLGAGELEGQITREVLARHESMLAALRSGKAQIAGDFPQQETTELLADLIADHEKDAFMLRALLWEVENTAA